MRIAVGALIGVLLACGLLASSCAPVAQRSADLEFWTLSLKPTYTDYVEGLRRDFERETPDLRVAWLDLPERVLFLKLLASVAAGDPPDLVNVGTVEANRLAARRALVSTDGIVDDAARRRYFPQLWNAVHLDGKSFSIPWYVSVSVLMYNKDMFRAAGLDPSRPPTTWDEIEAAARAVRKSGQYGYLPVIRILEEWQADGLPVLDATGRRAAFATPAHAARLEAYARLYRDDVIPPETLTGGYPEAVRRYKEGRLAMLATGPQFLLSIRQDAPTVYAATGVAPLPRGKAGIVPAAVMHFVIPVGSRNPAAAAKLGLSLTSPRNQLALCRLVPLLPSTVETASDPLFTRGAGEHPLEDEAIRIDAAQLPYARDLNISLPKADVINRTLQEMVERAVYGRAPAMQALQEAARTCDEALQKGEP